jgi:c-di-GMP-related signal transduction protein
VTSSCSARTPAESALKPGTCFVARQPILSADEKVFGYELLFRDGVENFFGSPDADSACVAL